MTTRSPLRSFAFFAGLSMAAHTSAQETVEGDLTVNGSIGATGSIDANGNTLSFGDQAGNHGGAFVYQDEDDDTLTFSLNRYPASWLWVHNAGIPAMRLSKLHELFLYQADGTTAGLALLPSTSSLRLGASATLTGDIGGAISTSGPLTVAGGLTNSSGVLNGGASGLTISAGAAHQHLVLAASGTGDLVFRTGGVERVRITDSGQVGMNTTSPLERLHVKGNLLLESANTNLIRIVPEPTVNDRILQFENASASPAGGWAFRATASSYNATRLKINNDGNVGIGTANPVTRFHVVGQSLFEAAAPSGVVIQNPAGDAAYVGSMLHVRNAGLNPNQYFSLTADYDGDQGGAVNFGALGNGPANSLAMWNPTGAPVLLQPAGGGVGIGNSLPMATLDVGDSSSASDIFIGRNYAGTNRILKGVSVSHASVNVPSALQVGMQDGSFAGMTVRNLRDGSYNSQSIEFNTHHGNASSGTRMVIDKSGRVGIGTVAPTTTLVIDTAANPNSAQTPSVLVQGSGDKERIEVRSFGTASPVFQARAANGTQAAPTAVNSGRTLGWFLAGGYNGSAWVGTAGIQMVAEEAFTTGDQGTSIRFHTTSVDTSTRTEVMRITPAGRVGIGTTAPGQDRLAVNGTIRAKEVIVTNTGWADYVFEDDYRLAPLAEVEAHIRDKKHLPGIPSAAEVASSGVSMGEMQAKMMAKIEELTLHLIRMEKENASLRSRVTQLETENRKP